MLVIGIHQKDMERIYWITLSFPRIDIVKKIRTLSNFWAPTARQLDLIKSLDIQ